MRAITQFIRNFNRQKVVGLLNVSSLALGVMVAIVVGLWAINELSFDTFHRDHDRIYRIIVRAKINDADTAGALSWPFVAAGGLVLVLSFVCVGWQSYRAATANPVESLKAE